MSLKREMLVEAGIEDKAVIDNIMQAYGAGIENAKSQAKSELQAENDTLKQQLEQHFAESATLLTTLAEDYKKLYSHLAQSSSQLLSSEKQAEVLKLLQHQDENQPRGNKKNRLAFTFGS